MAYSSKKQVWPVIILHPDILKNDAYNLKMYMGIYYLQKELLSLNYHYFLGDCSVLGHQNE